MSSPAISIRITAAAAKALARIAAVTKLEPEDIVNATIGCVAAHVRNEKKLAMPFRILTEEETPVWIGPEGRERLADANVREGSLSSEYLGGELLLYALGMVENGRLKRVPAAAASETRRAPAHLRARPPLELPVLRNGLAHKFAMVADIPELHPQDFVNGIFKSFVEDFLDPNQGLLAGYADNGVMYASQAAEHRVKRRVASFNKRRAKLIARREQLELESGVES